MEQKNIIKFSILELIFVPNFNLNWQTFILQTKFAQLECFQFKTGKVSTTIKFNILELILGNSDLTNKKKGKMEQTKKQIKYTVLLTMWHHLFLVFWLVSTWFLAHWRHQRLVTRLESVRQLIRDICRFCKIHTFQQAKVLLSSNNALNSAFTDGYM